MDAYTSNRLKKEDMKTDKVFPTSQENYTTQKGTYNPDYMSSGLTKRELFAVLAMQSRINAHCPTRSMTDQEIKFISIDSIRCAYALINELNKQNETD